MALHHYTDADILKEMLTALHDRHANKASPYLIKVMAHRDEPLNKGADREAEHGREYECIIWNDRTNVMVYILLDGQALRAPARNMVKRITTNLL